MAKDRVCVGVDLGGTNISAGVLRADGVLRGRAKSKTKPDKGFDEVVERIGQTVEKALAQAKLGRGAVAGVGIGAPGVLDFKKGVVVNAPNLRWTDAPLGEALSKRLDLPVTLDNDVNVGAWGEYRYGGGKGYDDLFAIFVGTGIGGGLILNGRLYRGHFATAGEIGHTTLHPHAPLGRRTLENWASRTAVVNRLRELILSNHPSMIPELVEGDLDRVRSGAIAKAVEAGDPLACEVVGSAAHDVGVAIANVVTVLSLPCVVLGGGLTEAVGKRFVEQVRASFERHVFPAELGQRCRLVASQLGDDAGLVGAALLAQDRLT